MSKQRKIMTLVIVREKSSILLGYKKRGFGCGKWNGFGGKVECGETIVCAAKRELFEECNLMTDHLDLIGILTFEFIGDPILYEVHVFCAYHFSGQIQESDEMKPQWFLIEDIPYMDMLSDDSIWFPLMLNGIRFTGYFRFKDHTQIDDYILNEVNDDNSILKPIQSID